MNRCLWAEQLEGSPQIRDCCGTVQKDWRPRNCCAAQSPHEQFMTQELEELLRIPDAARILGIKQKTLRDWVWRRKITFVKVGKGVAFRPSDLRDFIEKNVVRRSESPKSDEGWMFPSPVTGRCYHASPIQQDYIRPAGRKLGLGDIGWHTFRHTYRSWLDSVGTSMGVQQKLMRHAQIATTMNVYGDAMMESKRAANSKVVQMALRPALREAK